MSERKLHFETLQLHVGQEQADPVTDSRAVPIYQTTSYVFPNSQNAADRFALRAEGNIYGRLTNSTEDVFEKRIAALEGGVAALAVASGAAAIDYTLQALAQNGGHIVAQKSTAQSVALRPDWFCPGVRHSATAEILTQQAAENRGHTLCTSLNL